MAHRPMVNGAVYEIDKGKDLVNGAVYEIDKGKTLVGGTVYEVGFSFPCTVTIKSQVAGVAIDIFDKAYVTLEGQTYKATQMSGTSVPALDVATVVVPSGTVMHCYLNGSDYMVGGTAVNVNGVTVAGDTMAPSLVEYDYTVNGNIEVLLGVINQNSQMMVSAISITEL